MYKTQNGWTKQRIIEQIKHRNNGEKAGNGEECFYRTKDGNACFAGCFIPDEDYKKEFESRNIFALMSIYPELVDKMPLPAHGMDELQRIHDKSFTGENLHEKMERWVNDNVEE
jgi:hypothetical protein